MKPYYFHEAIIYTLDDGSIKIVNPNGFTVHQLPDLIRTLQTISARHQAEEAKTAIQGLRRGLKGDPTDAA